MTPLGILMERAAATLEAFGPSAREELIRQIEDAVRGGEHPARVRDLDHILQLVEFRSPAPEMRAPAITAERVLRWTGDNPHG